MASFQLGGIADLRAGIDISLFQALLLSQGHFQGTGPVVSLVT